MKKITLLAMSLFTALVVNAQDAGKDITGQLTNPDFEAGSDGWTIDGPTGGQNLGTANTAANNNFQGTHFMEAWCPSERAQKDFTWSQTLDVPNGFYLIKALAHAIRQNDINLVPTGVYLFAGEAQTSVTTTSAAEYIVLAEVTDGTLTIGLRGEGCNSNWIACDHFRVIQCYGETEAEAKNSWAKCEMLLMQEDLMALMENDMEEALKDEINETFAEIETTDDAMGLWEVLKEQAAEAEACVTAYENLTSLIDEVYELLDEGEENDAYYELEDILYEIEDTYFAYEYDAEGALAAIEELNAAVYAYNLSLTDGTSGFDVTKDYLTNPTLRSKLSDSKQGWETFTITPLGWTASPAWGTDLLEIWNCDFEISQTLTDLPNGKYTIYVQAFYRSGRPETAVLFGNDDKVSLTPLKKYTTSDFGSVAGGFTGEGLANNLEAASSVFNTYNPATGRNFYDENELTVIVMDGTLKFGVKSTNSEGGAWCALRDFRLEYFGNFPSVNLLGKIQKAEAFIDEHYDAIPSAERAAMTKYLNEISDYTAPEYADSKYEEEVNAVISELDARWVKFEEAMAAYAELKALWEKGDKELRPLNYPGLEALKAELQAVYACFASNSAVNTYGYLVQKKADLEAAIVAYICSQVSTKETPADYNYFLPALSASKTYTFAPWVAEVVGEYKGDVWQGSGQRWAVAEGDTIAVTCFNSWSDNFVSMDIYYDLENMPNGLYSFSVDAITQSGCLNDQHGYLLSTVDKVETNALSMEGWDLLKWETLTSGRILVTDGKLRVGFASTSNGGTNGWFQFGNLKLYYHGEASDEDYLAAWEKTKARAEEALDILIPNEKKELAAALTDATPLAAEGKYADACTLVNPVTESLDSIIGATKDFYAGYYAKLDTIRLYDAYDGCEMVYSFADAAIALADAILAADTTTCRTFPTLHEQLHSYANYAAALRDAENASKDEEAGYKQEHIDYLMNSIVAPQVAELTASMCDQATCDAMTEELNQAVSMLQKSLIDNGDAEVGDVSYLIVNADIESDLEGNWVAVKGTTNNCGKASGEHYSGVGTNNYLDAWAPDGKNNASFYQELVGIPNGIYTLKVAARTDGDNVWIYAATAFDVKDASTQWIQVVNNGASGGSIWNDDKLAWEAAGSPEEDVAVKYPYYMANNGKGFGWNWHVIENIEVTNRYLSVGISVNPAHTGKDKFTGSWFGADDWSLVLVEKNEEQSVFDPFGTGIESVEAAPVVKGIYDLFGRRIETITVPGIYIVNGKKVLVK